MKKRLLQLFLALLCVTCVSVNTYANLQSAGVANGPEGAIRVSHMMIVDTFIPLTHYNEGDMNFAFAPIYFGVDALDKEGDSEEDGYFGDDMYGWAVGGTINYALSDTVSIYASLNRVYMQGKVVEQVSGYDLSVCDGQYLVYTFQTGLGYDIIKLFSSGRTWSIPVIAAFYYQYYDLDLRYTKFDSTTVRYRFSINDTASSYGIFFGFALSRKFSVFGVNFAVTPYLLWFLSPMQDPNMSAEVVEDTTSNYAVGSTQDLDIGGHIDGIYPGLNISYEGEGGLGITLSLGGLIGNRLNYYNDFFYGGMEISVYSLAVTYTM